MKMDRWLHFSLYPNPLLFVVALVVFDLILSILIVGKVPYTEIDWIAYMQEVKGYLDGETNYTNLKGDTGPLVYPAGFIYVFSLLRYFTNDGLDIFKGQCIFIGLYLFNLIIILVLYLSSVPKYIKTSAWIFFSLVLSKRIHSIYMLRMFNDCIAVLLGHIALLFFVNQKWRIGSVFYSLAVSVKMNILLQAPGLLILYLLATGFRETIICLTICASIQIILALPFLTTFPVQYIQRSFDLGRVFMYKWTVNFKFLSEETFVSKELSIGLLILTLIGMIAFAYKWVSEYNVILQQHQSRNGAPQSKKRGTKVVCDGSMCVLVPLSDSDSDNSQLQQLSPHFIISTIFTSNLIGIALARSLHYQFYCWYFHSLPYLTWCVWCWSWSHGSTASNRWGGIVSCIETVVKALVLVSIEIAFNVYPSTWWSSLLLQVSHGLLLLGIFTSPIPYPFIDEINKKIK